MRWSTPLAPLAAVLALLAAVHLVAADTCYGPVKSATKSETGKSYTEYTIDPWIVVGGDPTTWATWPSPYSSQERAPPVPVECGAGAVCARAA